MNKKNSMENHTKNIEAFSNIAEGTHAGSITLKAGEDIDNSHLLVKLDDSGEAIVACSASDLPIGVCPDECDINAPVSVLLAGSAESSFLCRCATDVDAGDILYTHSGGKVSNVAHSGCYKVGVALSNAQIGGLVEVDTQGFGTRAMQISDGGIYNWAGNSTTETLAISDVQEGDIVIASIAEIGGSETTVSAQAVENGITFVLDTAGTSSTKISWIVIGK